MAGPGSGPGPGPGSGPGSGPGPGVRQRAAHEAFERDLVCEVLIVLRVLHEHQVEIEAPAISGWELVPQALLHVNRPGAGRASVGVLVARVWEGGVDAPCEQRVEKCRRPALKRVTRGGRAAERDQPERASAPQPLSDRGEAGEVAQRRQAELRLQQGPLLGARHMQLPSVVERRLRALHVAARVEANTARR